MITYIANLGNSNKKELKLIESLLNFENIWFYTLQSDSPTELKTIKKYYKGCRPAILICKDFIDIDKNPKVLYGFWQLTDYINKNGLIQA